MAGNLGFALEELLKDHQVLSFQSSGVEAEEHVNGSAGLRGNKGSFTSYLGLFLTFAYQQRFPGFLVHENTFQSVLLANG